jgi:hypothetical protein
MTTAARQRHYAPHELLEQRRQFEDNVSVTYPEFNDDDFRAVDLAYAQQKNERLALAADFRALDVSMTFERGLL